MRPYSAIVMLVLILSSCATGDKKMFSDVSGEVGISFVNELSYTEEFNPYTYRNFYNGAGVSLGDINNDGLVDIYLTGNMVDNKLYLNLGNWKFKDITSEAGVGCPNVWSTGATFTDVNQDGLLDLYVCKSGKPEGTNRHNELFINNGDNTFREESKERGLDITGLSTHAAFFDYDKDGDLDVYILTNSIRSIGLGFDLVKNQREIPDPNNAGNKLLRNDGGKYTDVTVNAGIYTSNIGFGLGITLGDFNNDNWDDIFISNDFFERDYLYLNNRNGTFNEVGETYFESMSMGSMGADVGDLDNDGDLDLMVTEMLPATIERQRNKTMFETWDKYNVGVEKGYHHQFSRNALHLNNGSQFLEVSRMAGVSATEWSWGALICDLNNDGLNDVFVSNGIYKDLLDRDYLAFMANDEKVRQKIRAEGDVITELIEVMPSEPVANAVFKNKGELQFDNVSEEWGLAEPSYSNGSAYGDLDNDGDLDLIVNNSGMPVMVYRNNLDTTANRSVRIKLQGASNTFGIGAKISVWVGDEMRQVMNYPSKGFQSSVDPTLHIGLGSNKYVDSIRVDWPKGVTSVLHQVRTNKLLTVKEEEADSERLAQNNEEKIIGLKEIEFPYFHKENNFVDFDRERLIFQMYSNEGPSVSIIDQGIQAGIFLGGAKNTSGKLMFFDGEIVSYMTNFKFDSISEDTHSLFFDVDNDGDQDLLVTSGGRAYSRQSEALEDRLYLNKNGLFVRSDNLPKNKISTSTAANADFDGDGDPDLFIGERFGLKSYGEGGGGLIYVNDGKGVFADRTKAVAPDLEDVGMITDAEWLDLDNDGDLDLVVVGDWMSINVFINEQGLLKNASTDLGLKGTRGWWKDVEVADVDGDGRTDLIVGNHGENSFFETGTRMYRGDFDKNGTVEHIICHKINDQFYPIADRDELVAQMPSLKKKIFYYKDYCDKTISDLFSSEQLNQAEIFEVDDLKTSIFLNKPNGFEKVPLPKESQFSAVYAIESTDLNNDGFLDLILGGNQFLVKPQFGKLDALPGLILYGSASGFSSKNADFLNVKGQVRDIEVFELKDKKYIIFAINDGQAKLYEIKN